MGLTTIRNPWRRFPRLSRRRCLAEMEKDHMQRQVSSRWARRLWLKLGIGLTIVAWLLLVAWVVPAS